MELLPKRPKIFTGANPLLPNLNLQPPSPSAPLPPSTKCSPSLVPPPKPPHRKQVARKNTGRSRKPLNKLYLSSSSSTTDRDTSPPAQHPTPSSIPSSPTPSPPTFAYLPKPPVPRSTPTKPSIPSPSVPHTASYPPPNSSTKSSSPTKPSSSVPPPALSSPTPPADSSPYCDGFWDDSFKTRFALLFTDRRVLPGMLFDFPHLSSLSIHQYFDPQHCDSRCFSLVASILHRAWCDCSTTISSN